MTETPHSRHQHTSRRCAPPCVMWIIEILSDAQSNSLSAPNNHSHRDHIGWSSLNLPKYKQYSNANAYNPPSALRHCHGSTLKVDESSLVVPFKLITQLVLLGESFICPGSPWMFHEVFSSPSFFLLFSFLGNFRFMELFCLFSYFIYHLLHIDWLFCWRDFHAPSLR